MSPSGLNDAQLEEFEQRLQQELAQLEKEIAEESEFVPVKLLKKLPAALLTPPATLLLPPRPVCFCSMLIPNW